MAEDERSMIRADGDDAGEYNELEDENMPEIRLREDIHSLLISAVCELKERIQNNQIEFKLLRAIHIL